MFKLRRLFLLSCLVGLALLVGACGSSMSGLKGRVIDTQGNGLAGITVIIPSAGLTVTTGENGTYQIAPLAPGVYSLFVTHEDYTVAGDQALMSILSSSASNTVKVKQGKITVVNDIVMKQSQQLDSIAFTSVTPGPQSTLTAGAEQSYAFEANYHLVSADTANLVISISFESINDDKTYPFFSAVTPISKGDNSVSFVRNDTVPNGKNLLYSIAIYDDDQNLLAHNATMGSPISGWKAPKAPSINAVGNEEGIKVTWNIDYPDYEYMEITRADMSTPLARYDRSAGMSSGELTDTNVYEGETKQYRACYITIDSKSSYCSNYATVDRPVRGLSSIPVNKRLAGLVYDPRRHLLYTLSINDNELLVVATDSGAITTIPVKGYAYAKFAMSGNGDWLFINLFSSIVAVNLNTRQTQEITTDNPVTAAIPNSDGSILYTVVIQQQDTKLQAIDWQTNAVLREVSVSNGVNTTNESVVMSPDGKYLFVYTYSAVTVYDTSDFSIAAYCSNPSNHLVINPNPAIPELYIGGMVFKAVTPWTQVDALPALIRAVKHDGSEIYATYHLTYGDTYLEIYRFSNLSYVRANRFILPGLRPFTPMVADDNTLYYLQVKTDGTYDIGVLDLTGR